MLLQIIEDKEDKGGYWPPDAVIELLRSPNTVAYQLDCHLGCSPLHAAHIP